MNRFVKAALAVAFWVAWIAGMYVAQFTGHPRVWWMLLSGMCFYLGWLLHKWVISDLINACRELKAGRK